MPLPRFLLLASLLPLSLAARDLPATPPPATPVFQRDLPATLAPTISAAAGVYSIDGAAGPPTDEETLYLEYINRARQSPAAEGARLRDTQDTDVVATYNYYHVDLAAMAAELQAISPAPPLAFNAQLLDIARAHTQDQFDNQYQGHTGSDGSTLATRASAVGYPWNNLAENVFSYADSVFHGHAGFEVDWGGGTADGMQPGRGHRANIHSPNLHEIGVGVIVGTHGSVGPQVVTQDFGSRAGLSPLLTGVAYFDFSGDQFYSLGEGLGGITVSVNGSTATAVTAPSGAFTLPLPGPGTYTVHFDGLSFSHSATVTSTGANVKLDFTPTYTAPALDGATTVATGVPTPYMFSAVPGATGYTLGTYRRSTAAVTENAENTHAVSLDVSSGYSVLQTSVKAQGASAFNLRHTEPTTQTLTLDRRLLARAGARLSFASRLGTAASGETARVQISTDDGATWADLDAQDGKGAVGETSFATRAVDLSPYAGRVFRLRFAYTFSTGTFYTSGPATGWYIDAIAFTNVDELLDGAIRDLGSATSFNYTASANGTFVLTITPRNFKRLLPPAEAFLLTADATAPSSPTAYLTNLSVRAAVVQGQTLIMGFVVEGEKPILIRAAGPALAKYDLPYAADPYLRLFAVDGSELANNDDWPSSLAPTFARLGASAFPAGSKDSALLMPVSGPHTAHATSNGDGIMLVEAYDADLDSSTTGAKLTNVSARYRVGTGDNVLIAGFVIGGTGTQKLLIRAVGPGLTKSGVTGVLTDPQLTVFNVAGDPIAYNDNWDSTLQPVFQQVGAGSLDPGSRDAALVIPLSAGSSYTVQVSGVGEITGEALVELYAIP